MSDDDEWETDPDYVNEVTEVPASRVPVPRFPLARPVSRCPLARLRGGGGPIWRGRRVRHGR